MRINLTVGIFAFIALSFPVFCYAEADYEIFNQETHGMKAPVNFQVHSSSDFSYEQYSPPEYQELLDQLDNSDYQVRERGAKDLYLKRNKYGYDIDLIIKYIEDDDEIVAQYITSAILDILTKKPYKRQGMKGYLDSINAVHRKVEDSFTKANCLALLSLTAERFDDIGALVETALKSGTSYERTNAAKAIQNFAPRSIELYRELANHISKDLSHYDMNVVLADAMVSIAGAFRGDTGAFTANRLLEGVSVLAPFKYFSERAAYINSIAGQIKANTEKKISGRPADVKTVGYTFDSTPQIDHLMQGPLKINRQTFNVNFFDPGNRRIEFLGETEPFFEGLNIINYLNRTYLLWFEDGILKKFDNPYKNSYAIIVAIDKYQSKGIGRYRDLGDMEAHARDLEEQFSLLGFPKDHIIPIYNGDATSTRVNETLQYFWYGGKYAQADRLVFYFGGHGDFIERRGSKSGENRKIGFLVTSDFDDKQPTKTSLLMRDLTGRHFDNIVTYHVLMLIDSCSSGLALPRFENSNPTEEELSKFQRIAVLKDELKSPARNIIVASTGSQKALWENGGIFTVALKDALTGAADFSGDKIIEFDELSLYIKNKVRARAIETRVEQEPCGWRADYWGDGGVVFLPPLDN